MPLLKKVQFQKSAIPENLKDTDEVFYCEFTDEIFRDYEEYSEKIILYNSMVWTCALTGKSNLTYIEALESEENARKSIQEFPYELRIPVLYLATKTQRTSFLEMVEDVFMYMKNRYFIGENVEASFTGAKWKDSHVLQVISPSNTQRNPRKNGIKNHDRVFWPPATAFKYEIEHLDADDNDISEMMIVDCNHVRRKKSSFNREKCKLFLKQYVVQDDRGIFVVKSSALEDFGIAKVSFKQIFDGPLPEFELSAIKKKVHNGSKQKQQTLANFLMKKGKVNGANKEKQSSLLEQLKKREEEFKVKKKLQEEEKQALRKQQKQDNAKVMSLVKNWYKPKEDLLLENQQKLPTLTPVISKIPDKYLGDVLMISEFVENFPKLLSIKDYFPGGLTFDVLERAMVEEEVGGPFADMVQMFLSALFNAQDEESNQYRTAIENTTHIKDEEVQDNQSLLHATRLATLASKWSLKYLGLPLSRLPLYPVTVSEILRLHLLSSGARINETGARWRYAQRGGYTNEADPGLHLRLENPHIIKSLGIKNITQLPLIDKIKIIDCLMNQLLTYADVRDIIEDKVEKVKGLRNSLKMVQISENKRKHEYLTSRSKMQKEMAGDPKLQDKLDKLQENTEKKQEENIQEIESLHSQICESLNLIGLDRAYRRYIKLNSIPGLFVNFEEQFPMECLPDTTHQNPELVNPTNSDLMNHFRTTLKKSDGSSPKKSPKKLNGSLNGSIIHTDKSVLTDLLMCNTDPETCIVHSTNTERQRWLFFHDRVQLEELESTLNCRGLRERELLNMVKSNKEQLLSVIEDTPANLLNPSLEEKSTQKLKPKRGKNKYDDVNLGYPADMTSQQVLENSLVDNILELEEKICAGALGKTLIKNREEWRNCLQNKDYDTLENYATKDRRMDVRKDDSSKSRSATPEIPDKKETEKYMDPAKFLCNLEIDTVDTGESESLIKSVKALSTALLQVAYSVEAKYLKKPLGHADLAKNDKKSEFDLLKRWEQSLMACTSYSQVFLHYLTLDSCIMWSRSALLARCRVCRRQKDSENMLLCDNCNLGHHMYCLKPKLTSIPQGDWYCDRCKKEKEKEEKKNQPQSNPTKRRKIFVDEDVEEEESVDEEQESDDEEDEDYIDQVKLCMGCGSGGEVVTCEKCDVNYHIECLLPPLRRAPRGPWVCEKCKNKKERKRRYSDSYSDSKEPKLRGANRRSDLPLHNAALQELLSDIIKHDDAWPFVKPVHRSEVPDYYDVIQRPMDFGTIKYRLNMGEYSEDSEVMDDVVLIFENCNTYNDSDAEVYKCGVRLLKFVAKRAKKLELEVPEELEIEEKQVKKPRIK